MSLEVKLNLVADFVHNEPNISNIYNTNNMDNKMY